MINKKKKQRSEAEIGRVKSQIEVYVKEGRKLQSNIRNARVRLLEIFYEARFTHNFNDKDITALSNRLGYTKSTKSKINTIVKKDVVMANLDSLPSNWGALYLLKDVADETLTRLINDKSINAEMSFRELHGLLVQHELIESKAKVVTLLEQGVFTVKFDDTAATKKQIEVFKTFQNGINALARDVIESGIQIKSSHIDLELLMTDDLEEVA